MKSEISIIIPTLNRPVRLKSALTAIADYMPQKCEVVVVDQSENSERCAAEIITRFPFVKIIRQSKKNLPLARNSGIKNSSAGIVLFIDDDCVIEKDCIESHIALHNHRSCTIVAGRVQQRGSMKWPESKTVTNINPRTGEATGHFDLNYEGDVDYVWGGHFSVKREVFHVTGMFNISFSGNALFEDIDFSLRARKCGFKIFYTPDAVVSHYSDFSGGCYESSGASYLLRRLHNHLLFYLLHFHLWPQKEMRFYLKNLIEFLSRKKRGKHSFALLFKSLLVIVHAYFSALRSFVVFPQYRQK